MSEESARARVTVAFLPWLRLQEPITIGEVCFSPIVFNDAKPEDFTEEIFAAYRTILSGYVDFLGTPVEDCSIVTILGRDNPWFLSEDDHGAVMRSAQFLMLAAISTNDYYCQLGSYCNSSLVQVVWQRYIESPSHIAVETRRRDGSTLSGGSKHGEACFSAPPQYARNKYTDVDAGFARALNDAWEKQLVLVQRLLPALSFFSLANTDMNHVLPDAELILLASAFEQLLEPNDREIKRDLTKKFGEAFECFGSVTADEAEKAGRAISFHSKYEIEQRKWFVHKKWIEELYDRRSHYVHGGTERRSNWGWGDLEHLVMGAFTFSLLVKILLGNDQAYSLSEEDVAKLHFVDKVLKEEMWYEMVGATSEHTCWRELLNQERWS